MRSELKRSQDETSVFRRNDYGNVQRISRQIERIISLSMRCVHSIANWQNPHERAAVAASPCLPEVEVSVSAPSEFEWIVTEIKAIEQARQDPASDSLTSLATLVVPSAASEGNRAQRDMELITPEERTELYRRRLRGLYLDLAEMLLAHQLVTEFPEARERVLSPANWSPFECRERRRMPYYLRLSACCIG